ncbi:hypothetical protein J2858_004037 [Neorhizobium galegae]|nr:hypothetical protein [Neorhizobium galegae]
MKKLSFWVMSLTALCAVAAPSHAADMIAGYRAAPQHKHRYYVVAPARDCAVLQVEYRKPYEPRTDYVELCTHPKRTTILARSVDY